MGETGTTGTTAGNPLAALEEELETMRGHKAAIVEELGDNPGSAEQELRRELRAVEARIRALNVKIFDATKAIKRVVAKPTACPCCERRLPLGTIVQGATATLPSGKH